MIKPTTKHTRRVEQSPEPDVIDMILELIIADRPDLRDHCLHVAAAIRREHGGGRVYIKSGNNTQEQREAQAARVRSAWNGRNAGELARLLGIGKTTVYRILRQPARER